MNYQIGDYIKATIKNTKTGEGNEFTIEGTILGIKQDKLCLENFKVLYLNSVKNIQLAKNVKSINQAEISRQIAMLRHPSLRHLF